MAKYLQGQFKPKNPEKYKGDPTNIIYRSSLELTMMMELDKNPAVIQWSSEEVVIPYLSPIDNRYHRYFMDFWVKKKNFSDGKLECVLIEVKPKAQTQPPKIQSQKKPGKRYLNEVKTWGINSAKWNAAEKYCKERGWRFMIITEKDLGR